MRDLTAGEIADYGGRYQVGWGIGGLCADAKLQLRVLLPKSAPYFPARIAVAPAPPVFTWPHLEERGILCLLSESANISVGSPGDVVLTLLEGFVRKNRGLIPALVICQVSDRARVRGNGTCGSRRIFS